MPEMTGFRSAYVETQRHSAERGVSLSVSG